MNSRLKPPGTWGNPDHFLIALTDPWYCALVKVQDTISVSTMQFFRDRGLTTLHLPITTNSISSPMGLGSDSKPLKVDILGVETFMADSMQFMLEYGLRMFPKGCYYLMPSFRGELADERHLCQFYHAEAEIRGTLQEIMQLAEEYLLQMTQDVFTHCGAEIERIAGSVKHIEQMLAMRGGFPRITFREAIQILSTNPRYIAEHPAGCHFLTQDGELELLRRTEGFVWVTHFDHLSVPFYQAFGEDPTTANAADLLFGMGEIVGAGERHVSEDMVLKALSLHGVETEPYDWYCRLKRVQPEQTAGFGLGTERYVCWLFQHSDIRDCQLLPRFNGQINIP